MTEHYFTALEQKIDLLLERCSQLEEENRQLSQRERQLREERNVLLQQNEQTQDKIKSMIMRLKTLEQNS